MKDSVEVACPSHNQCIFESKFLEAFEENQYLHHKLKEDEALFTEKFEELDYQVKFLTERKNSLEHNSFKVEQKRLKIQSLKKLLEEKDSEIAMLNTTIKINKEKINSLRNNRQQSVDMIKDLEEEIIQVKKQNNTPTHSRVANQGPHSHRSIPNNKLFKTQTFTFNLNEISEFSESRTCEQEKYIEKQSKLLTQERNVNKELKNKNQELKNENLIQEYELNQLHEQLENLETQFFQNKAFWIERIEKLRIENEDLKIRLREYQERDSGFNTSDYEGAGNLKDELSGLNISQKSKYFDRNSQDDISFLDLKYTIDSTFRVKELTKENQKMRFEISELHYENEKLKKDIEKRQKASAELNKILIDNEKSVKSLLSNFSFQSVSQEVKKLTSEKEKLLRDIDDYHRELLKLTERVIQKKLLLKRPYLEDKIDERPEESSPRKNSFRKKKPEGYKRKRNIASWGYDLFGYNN
jgi:chromosome segregation ATPase